MARRLCVEHFQYLVNVRHCAAGFVDAVHRGAESSSEFRARIVAEFGSEELAIGPFELMAQIPIPELGHPCYVCDRIP